MSLPLIRPEQGELGQVAKAIRDTLQQGGIGLIPVETTPALCANAENASAVGTLWKIRGIASEGETRPATALHVASRQAARELITKVIQISPLQSLLIDRFVPGGVQLAVPISDERLPTVLESIGIEPGVADENGQLLIRVPSHPLASLLLEICDFPVVMTNARAEDVAQPTTVEQALDRLNSAGTGDLLGTAAAAEPHPAGKASTTVRLELDGSLAFLREGLLEERFVRGQLRHTVLFVCTVNTCRSPMAAAIARNLLPEGDPGDVPIDIRSAGTTAMAGMPATPEAVKAMDRRGVEMGSHLSTPLTRASISNAWRVYAMTQSHLEMARAIAPPGTTVELLDPAGADVRDPIGSGQSVYDQTAEQLSVMIAERFAELGLTGATTA
ncbi:MAG: Sua5/YciO/YrdC/YwlC family protein [Planctomycetota bacterium]